MFDSIAMIRKLFGLQWSEAFLMTATDLATPARGENTQAEGEVADSNEHTDERTTALFETGVGDVVSTGSFVG